MKIEPDVFPVSIGVSTSTDGKKWVVWFPKLYISDVTLPNNVSAVEVKNQSDPVKSPDPIAFSLTSR